jgi:uncharacterized protein YrrD
MKAGLDIVGLPVMDVTGHTMGTVRNLVLDDEARQVLGISIAGRWQPGRQRFLSWREVETILGDRVIVGPAAPPAVPPPCADQALAGKAAISRTGHYLGAVANIYFDEATGAISAYTLARTGRARRTALSKIVPATARVTIADVMVIDPPA